VLLFVVSALQERATGPLDTCYNEPSPERCRFARSTNRLLVLGGTPAPVRRGGLGEAHHLGLTCPPVRMLAQE